MAEVAKVEGQGKKVALYPPDLNRLQELQHLISNFNEEHEFLWGVNKSDPLEVTAMHLAEAVQNFKEGTEFIFHIVEQSTGHLTGCIGIHEPRKELGYHSLGYWIGTEYMGRGYCTEAVILARNIALKHLNPNRLEIGTASSNHASKAIAMKAGFKPEAVLKNYCRDKNGQLDDGYFYTYALVNEKL